MGDTAFFPIAGINTVSEDAALQRGGDLPSLQVRDALNFNITPAGRLQLRPGVRRVSEARYRHLWQSPLHGDTFGVLDGQWVKIDPATIPGSASGKTTVRKVWPRLAPRSAEASSIVLGTRSSATCMGRIM